MPSLEQEAFRSAGVQEDLTLLKNFPFPASRNSRFREMMQTGKGWGGGAKLNITEALPVDARQQSLRVAVFQRGGGVNMVAADIDI